MQRNINDSPREKLTIADIAKALGVSTTTVSRAISGKGRIGAATKEKVLAYIEENNYRPSQVARGLAQSKTYNIGFIMPGDYDIVDLPFFQECMLGICEVASSYDYDVIISMANDRDLTNLKQLITNHKVDGIILSRTVENDAAIAYLQEAGVPFAVIGTTDQENVIQIDNNHTKGCEDLTTILLQKGLRKIALLGGNKHHIVTQSRYKGFEAAYANQNLKFNSNQVYLDVTNQIMTERIVESLVDEDVECILCMDDSICHWTLNALSKLHKHIPDDIKIASFYSSSILDNHTPPITSLHFDVKDLSMTTCKILFDYMDGKNVPHYTLLNYNVILKESTQ